MPQVSPAAQDEACASCGRTVEVIRKVRGAKGKSRPVVMVGMKGPAGDDYRLCVSCWSDGVKAG